MFYKMTLSAEETAYARVQMTEEEAKIVNRVLRDLHANLSGGEYCGSCSIDMDMPSETENPMGEYKCGVCEYTWEAELDTDCCDDYCPMCQENENLKADNQ